MSRDEQAIESEIQARGLNAPRLTPQHIDSLIASEFYFTASDGVFGASGHRPDSVRAGTALGLLTICVLVLRNGFAVTGESACASPENFDGEIGRKVAREKAREKIWALEGYLLRQSLWLIERDIERDATREPSQSIGTAQERDMARLAAPNDPAGSVGIGKAVFDGSGGTFTSVITMPHRVRVTNRTVLPICVGVDDDKTKARHIEPGGNVVIMAASKIVTDEVVIEFERSDA